MATRWAQVVRGGLVASTAVFVAALSHVAAGGSAPGAAGTAIAFAFALLASVAVAGRRPSLPRIALAVTFSQFLFHLVFSLGGDSSVTMTQDGHHGAVVMGGGADSMASMDHSGGGMWVAHAVAAVVTIVFLWRGERELWRLLSTASRQLVSVVLGWLVFVPVASRNVATRVAPTSLSVFRDDLGVVLAASRRRGPPVGSFTI